MSYEANDFRYDVFSQTFIPLGIGYLANPKEIHIIPASAPYEIQLNEIPRGDSPSTLLINIQAGADFEEVSFSTPPSEGQFRAVYGSDIVPPVSIVGQGTVQFNSADAGKTVECAYYGLGTIIQNQFFNKLIEGEFGVPDSIARAVNYLGDSPFYVKEYSIGDWDMDTDDFVIISTDNINRNLVRDAVAVIRSNLGFNTLLSFAGSVGNLGTINITLERDIGGLFDSPTYNGTLIDRGTLYVTYGAT